MPAPHDCKRSSVLILAAVGTATATCIDMKAVALDFSAPATLFALLGIAVALVAFAVSAVLDGCLALSLSAGKMA